MLNKQTGNLYKAYGLNILSDFELDNLLPGDGVPDVYIEKGYMPNEVFAKDFTALQNNFGKDFLMLNIKNAGVFLITKGKKILVEIADNADPKRLNLYLLGSAISVILQQRGYIPIHGSSLVIDNKCMVITGKSGSGKSTLSRLLLKHGHAFIADDISAVVFENNKPVVYPGYPHQKLWEDSINNLISEPNCFQRIEDERNKYFVPVNESFHNKPARLDAIFEINIGSGSDIEIQEIKGSAKLLSIVENSYRLQYTRMIGRNDDHFDKCRILSQHVRFFRITRPENILTVEKQAELLYNIVKSDKFYQE